MPQLEFSDYPPQVVWLVITFALLYFLLTKIALPSIARTLKERDGHLQGDIERAEKLKSEAEAALAAYRKAISEARLQAQAAIKETAEAMAAEAAQREGELAGALSERTKAAEARIAAAKGSALAELKSVAGEAAHDLVARLAGSAPAQGDVAAAVEAAGRERA